MEKVNLIVVIGRDGRFLLCRRRKEPYTGKLNFVGGHIEPGESGEDAAYRELEEETGIRREDISLRHVIDFTYYAFDVMLEVWAGRLGCEVEVYGEENDLLWYTPDADGFRNLERFAGDGNMQYILNQLALLPDGLI